MNRLLSRRLKFLECLVNPKMPMLVLQCDRCPTDAQMLEIARAEQAGRRIVLFGRLQSWCWLGASDVKPWLDDPQAVI